MDKSIYSSFIKDSVKKVEVAGKTLYVLPLSLKDFRDWQESLRVIAPAEGDKISEELADKANLSFLQLVLCDEAGELLFTDEIDTLRALPYPVVEELMKKALATCGFAVNESRIEDAKKN